MKYMAKIFLFLLILFFVVIPSVYSSNVKLGNHFTVPQEVSNNTKIAKPIRIFYEYTEAFYSLPDDQAPTDIFREPELWDPLEYYNRVAYSFNLYAAKWVIRPLGSLYSFVVPDYVREGIGRVDANIQMPGRLINALLQAKFTRAGVELARFGINTTIGIAGFYDPAYKWFGMEPRIIDFGLTFAYWGIGKGFYLILPVYGSTCLRDAVGLIGDYFTNPITYIPPYFTWNWVMTAIRWGIKGGLAFNNMTLQIESFMRLNQSSLDPYESMKTMWGIFEGMAEARDAME